MGSPEKYDAIVFGAGTAGKVMAWNMTKAGRRTAVVERKYIGGACPNVACLPSKNVIHSAKVASLVARHREFGIETGPTSIDMMRIYARKREMVDTFVKIHLDRFRGAGDELIIGDGTFVAEIRQGDDDAVDFAFVFTKEGRATLGFVVGFHRAVLAFLRRKNDRIDAGVFQDGDHFLSAGLCQVIGKKSAIPDNDAHRHFLVCIHGRSVP